MRVVHLCIDLQDGMSFWIPDYEWPDLVKNAFRLKNRLKGIGIPTVHIGFVRTAKDEIGRMDEVCHKLIEKHGIDISRDKGFMFDIPVTAEDLVAIKSDYSVTSSRSLVAYLKDGGFDTVIISGVFEAYSKNMEERCLSLSAVDLAKMGLQTIIAAEATNVHTSKRLSLEERRSIHSPLGVEIQPIEDIMRVLVANFHTTLATANGIHTADLS